MLPTMMESIELGEDHSLIQIHAPKEFQDKTLRDLQLRSAYGINIVALRRPEASSKSASDDRYNVIVPLPERKKYVSS